MPLSENEIWKAADEFSWSEQEEREVRELHQEFLKLYPREQIPHMTLDEYALGRGKNGACYWLEFRTQKIGSIGGSTAFKHIVYFDTKNQRWRYKNFLSETEAFEAVKSGLAQLLDLAERDQFADIEQVAPFTGQNLTRGKWLYMYFPGKFLPIFSTDNLADFCHVLGIALPDPPSATLLNRALLKYKETHLTFSTWSNYRFARFLYSQFPPISFWKIAPGKNAEHWEACKAGGFICLGWDELGDLNKYDDRQALKKAMLTLYPDGNKRKASEPWNFAHLDKGDIIIANRGISSIVGVGRVTGPYAFDPQRATFKHYVPVEWFQAIEYPISDKALVADWFGYTVKKLTRQEYEALYPGRHASAMLRWHRCDGSYDLVLENVESLTRQGLAELYEHFMESECQAQPGFNERLRNELKVWVSDPTQPLPSVAYVSLSNWFTTPVAALRSSPRSAAARKLWDALFVCAPVDRLSSPESDKNHIILDEPFQLWWSEQQKRQGQSTTSSDASPSSNTDTRFDRLCAETFLPASFFEDCEHLLGIKRQFIIQGAPGTGKTYVAGLLASWWAGDGGRVLSVQFHESYGYEDFVHGIKPRYDAATNTTRFMPEDGVFVKFCEEARKNPARHVLIIDEINRAKTSRVFGELLYWTCPLA